jgi:hypothetical protein
MKTAYLILAHNQPMHLHRLIDALTTNNNFFFIHLDKKSNILDFHPESYPENVMFPGDRIKIHHGGFSLVRAMIQLLTTASTHEGFDYYQFLSGWDYPIKNKQYIDKFLSQNYPTNYLNFYSLTKPADYVENITKYYFTDMTGNLPLFLQKPMKSIQYIAKRVPFDRPFFPGMVPYRGSCWFCINNETVNYIIDFINSKEGKRYYNFFKNVDCPDEIFFQTIIINSPYAKYCRYYDRDINSHLPNENKAYLHYIDWSNNRENPAIFNENDFQTLMNEQALYARKFTENKSLKLLDMIDNQIGAIQ